MCNMNNGHESLEIRMNPWVVYSRSQNRLLWAHKLHTGRNVVLSVSPGKPEGQRHYVSDAAI